jgi:hypothetical protein
VPTLCTMSYGALRALTRAAHATQGEFGNPDLIVRRGHRLNLTVALEIPMDTTDRDEVVKGLSTNALTIAPSGRGRSSYTFPAGGTFRTSVADEREASKAALEGGMCITTSSSDSTLEIAVLLSHDMPVGEYVCQVHLGGQGPGLNAPEPMMVLFNPWCEEADEYIPDEAACDEYVMNEDGLAHFGAWNRSGRMAWNYGQFEPSVLAAARKVYPVARAVQMAYRSHWGSGEISCSPLSAKRIVPAQ